MLTDRLGLTTLLPGWPLALFRIAFGLLYLDATFQKAPWIVTDGHRFGWLYGFIEKEIAHPTFGWYKAFLEAVVLPNFTLFGLLTFGTELALGLGLLLGLLTRLAGLGGFLWQVNIALGAYNVPGEWFWIWPLLTLPQFCFAFCGAGRVLGLDCWLEPALRRQPETASAWARLLRYAV
ncbi:MAG: TQO small subunit DoxD [Candidatus Methylomirabilales bacterium]